MNLNLGLMSGTGQGGPARENLYSNWELVGGSDIVQDVPQAGLPDLHALVFNTTFPCDATYLEVATGEFSYDFNSAQDEVRLLLQQTIGGDGRFEVGKIYRYQAKVRTVTGSPTGSDVRALHIATTVDLNILDADNSFIGENSGYILRWIDFEVTATNGRGNFRHGAGVFDPVYTEQQTIDIAIYEIGGQVPTVGTLDFPDATEGQPYSYNLSTIISGATSYGYNGILPADIDFNSSTGLFSSADITSASTSETLSVYGINEYGQSADSNSDELTVIPVAGCVLDFDGTNYMLMPLMSTPAGDVPFSFEVDMQINGEVSSSADQVTGHLIAPNRLYIGRQNTDSGGSAIFGLNTEFYNIGYEWVFGTRYKLRIEYEGGGVWVVYNNGNELHRTTNTAINLTQQISIGSFLSDIGTSQSNIVGQIFSASFTVPSDPSKSYEYTLNSGSTTVEPSDNFPANSAYNGTYHSVETIDWDCNQKYILNLTGTQYGTMPSSLQFANIPFVFEAKIKITGEVNSSSLQLSGLSGTQRLYVGRDSTDSGGNIVFGIFDVFHRTDTPWVVGDTHTLRMEYESGNCSLYIDDAIESTIVVLSAISSESVGVGASLNSSGVAGNNIVGTVYSQKYVQKSNANNTYIYTLDSGNLDREPSDNKRPDNSYDVLYTGLDASNWTEV